MFSNKKIAYYNISNYFVLHFVLHGAYNIVEIGIFKCLLELKNTPKSLIYQYSWKIGAFLKGFESRRFDTKSPVFTGFFLCRVAFRVASPLRDIELFTLSNPCPSPL